MKFSNFFLQRRIALWAKISNPRSGVTLIELIIYMGIFSILIAMLSQLFSTTLETRQESEAVSYVAQDSRYILSRLLYDVRSASDITTPSSLGSQTTTLQLTINGSSYTYQGVNNNLLVNGSQLNSFNTSISNLSFQKFGNIGGKPSVKLSYTVTGRVSKKQGVQTKTVQTTVDTR